MNKKEKTMPKTNKDLDEIVTRFESQLYELIAWANSSEAAQYGIDEDIILNRIKECLQETVDNWD